MKKEKSKIYFDYAATTPVDPLVLKSMTPYFSKKFGNTVSFHSFGQEAKQALEESRERVAEVIFAKPEEIIFTSSATESNNLALKGAAFSRKKGKIIISSIEHSCIIETAKWLESQGFEVVKLKVDKYGRLILEDLQRKIDKKTILVSIIHASNEIGTIQPIKKVGQLIKKFNNKNPESKIYFHTDAVQSFGKIPINVNEMNLDLLTASSHKMYGPKGAALLFIRNNTKITPLFHGGGQELGLRPSTVNLPAIVGFGRACLIAEKNSIKENARLIKLRDKLISGILKKIPNSHLNGHLSERLPNNANFRFDFVEGESIVLQLDLMGIAASTGSACSSNKLEPSHVLLATGLKHEQVHGSLRLTLGKWTEEKEVNYLLKVLPEIIKNLRKISGNR